LLHADGQSVCSGEGPFAGGERAPPAACALSPGFASQVNEKTRRGRRVSDRQL
jgi:hypothetical protein